MTISLSVTDADEIFRRYYRPLCLYALHYLRSTEDAEDVVQDCLTDFLERSLLAERPENVKSYLYIMVRNRCLDTLRRDSHIDRSLSAEEFDESIAESEYMYVPKE